MATADKNIERHPLEPFLPETGRVLLLGSFPPPQERWGMNFFYPNPQNDMWRIMGQVFFGDRLHFIKQGEDCSNHREDRSNHRENRKKSREQGRKDVFRHEAITAFCEEHGIAIFDTAQAVIRLQGNAADEHLEIIEPTDIAVLLQQLPLCHDICCTGGKAAETLAETLHTAVPKTGGYVETLFAGRSIRFWRMPSSSRAYPLPLEKKAAAYQHLFAETGVLYDAMKPNR